MRRPTFIPRASSETAIAGLTLIELILTCGILLILSSAAIPMFRITIQRKKEAELRYDLREMRNAIDRYKDDADKNLIRTEVGSQNYPPDLETLVDGVTVSGGAGAPGAGGVSASALAGASNTSQFGSAGTQQLGAGGASQFVRARQRQPSHVRLNQQGALSAENSRRPDDWKSRLGPARRAGRTGFRQLGRAQRFRRLFQIHRPRRLTERNIRTGSDE